MKHKLHALIITLIILAIPEFASAQNRTTTTRPSNQRTATSSIQRDRSKDQMYFSLPYNSSFAHWSVGISGGVSVFDGDIRESGKRVIPTSKLYYVLGLNVERTFTPIFGLGFGYDFIPYAAEPDKTNNRMEGTAHEMQLYLSLNMLNLFYHSRPQKWGLFLNVGMGISYYNAEMKDKTTGAIIRDTDGTLLRMDDGVAWVWPFALSLEYNISKYIAIGLKADYRLHDKDNYEGHPTNVRKGNWNDAFELLSLTVRLKPHFGKTYHVRNLSYGDSNIRDLNRRLAEMEQQIADMKKPDSCCIEVMDRINNVEEVLDQKMDTGFVKEIEKIIAEKGISDRVIADSGIGYKPAPTPAPAVVASGDDFMLDERLQKIFNEALRGIQFETARAEIKTVSYPILDNIVMIMKENPRFDLDIIGHTDNVGSAESNQDLSDRRANAVRQYLMEKGVSGTRLTSSGKGLTDPIATNSTVNGRALNRRVEFVVKHGNKVIYKTEKR